MVKEKRVWRELQQMVKGKRAFGSSRRWLKIRGHWGRGAAGDGKS